jgi:hypothetical protein
MHHPRGVNTAALALLWACGSSHAQSSCESIAAVVDAKIRATGTQQFTLSTVDAAASAPGRVVGNCAMGAKKILYLAGGAASAATAAPAATAASAGAKAALLQRPPAKPDDPILTECNDGSMSVGGTCKR